jgi:hypothetical protein
VSTLAGVSPNPAAIYRYKIQDKKDIRNPAGKIGDISNLTSRQIGI